MGICTSDLATVAAAAEIVGFLSCEGAPVLAATTARQKAFTAVRTGMATKDWKAYTDSIPADEQKIIDKIDGYIAADGGYPIVEDGGSHRNHQATNSVRWHLRTVRDASDT